MCRSLALSASLQPVDWSVDAAAAPTSDYAAALNIDDRHLRLLSRVSASQSTLHINCAVKVVWGNAGVRPKLRAVRDGRGGRGRPSTGPEVREETLALQWRLFDVTLWRESVTQQLHLCGLWRTSYEAAVVAVVHAFFCLSVSTKHLTHCDFLHHMPRQRHSSAVGISLTLLHSDFQKWLVTWQQEKTRR